MLFFYLELGILYFHWGYLCSWELFHLAHYSVTMLGKYQTQNHLK